MNHTDSEYSSTSSSDSNASLGKTSECVSDSGTVCSCLGENCNNCNEREEISEVVKEPTPILDDDGLPFVTANDLRNYKKYDKRVFMRAVTSAEINRVNDKLFEKGREVIDVKVSRMTQALRFWLAVKFSTYSNWRYNGKKQIKFGNEKVCELFGINYSSFKNFMSKNRNVRYAKLKYLSPVEINPRTQRAYFKTYASNYDDLNHDSLFGKGKGKSKGKRNNK